MNFDFKSGAAGQLSAVATTGKLLFPAQTCKDYTKDGISRGVQDEWATKRKQYDPGVKGKQISRERPLFVFWTAPRTVERNAMKFTQLINQVETIMDVPHSVAYPVDTGITAASAPFVAEASAWWLKSPVAVDAYLMFMRLSITMRLDEDLQEFIDRVVKIEKHAKYSITRNAKYLRVAKEKGNLTGLLEKTLPCLNREGYSDYLLSYLERGFSQYDINSDKDHPMDEVSLVELMNKTYTG